MFCIKIHVNKFCDFNLTCMNHYASPKRKLWQLGTGALVSFVAQWASRLLIKLSIASTPVQPIGGAHAEKLTKCMT